MQNTNREAERARITKKAERQVSELPRYEGGSLRLLAFQIRDTMQDLINLVDEEAREEREATL